MASLKWSKPRDTNKSTQERPYSPGGSSTRRSQAYAVAGTGLDLIANVAEASDVLSPLKAACKVAKSILDIIQAVDDNLQEWVYLKRRLEEYMSALEKQIESFEKYTPEERVVEEALSRPLIHYVEVLEDIHSAVVDRTHKQSRSGFAALRRAQKIRIDAGEIQKFNRDIEDRHRQFMEALGIFTALRVQPIERTTNIIKSKVETILTDVDAAAILQLPMAAFVPSSVHTTCLQGTRQAVLETLWSWADNNTNEKPIFWLCDIAGSGKSTVAMSAVERWRAEGILGGQFFFSMASGEGATTEKFCSTIARGLAHYIPELAPHVAEAVKRNPAVLQDSIRGQLYTLVVEPLRERQKHAVLVIDAVDECKSGPQRKDLLEALAAAARESTNLKVLVTSRPDPVIETILQPLSIKAELRDRLHSVAHHDNIDDIATYVHKSLSEVLSQDKRQRIVEKANGLFIWASTACRMLTSETNWSDPDIIYDRLLSNDQPGDIDEIYDLVLERTDPKFHAVMWKMLALLLAAFEPLTVSYMDDIIKHTGADGSGKALVRNLGSLVTEDGKTGLIQFRHPTLVEYLQRCSGTSANSPRHKTLLDIADAHGRLASWSLKWLRSRKDGLRFNICRIESSFYLNQQIMDIQDRVSRFIPKQVQYASCHWPFHIGETNDKWRQMLKNEFGHVIQSPEVLYWMEVLSVTRGVPRAIAGLRAITRHISLEEGTRSRITDLRCFLMAFLVPIQDSVPHIYISALAFAPKKSKLSTEALKNRENILTVTQGLEEGYGGLPEALLGHSGLVRSVSFSPDGSRIASGSEDSTIQLWDVETGQPMGEPLKGHESFVCAVAFSPDGSQIISCSSDTTIRMWDTETLQPIGEPLRGHSRPVVDVAFSPDGSRFISGAADSTIRLWDAGTGQPIGEPLRGHISGVSAVAFSPDGSRIVSGSVDHTLRLWNAETGQPMGKPLRGHKDSVLAVAFSPDGSRIVSGSADHMVRIWDAEAGHPIGGPLRGHSNSVYAVTFSPDSSKIASGSWDGSIQLWDAESGQQIGEALRNHKGSVLTVAFSPDGSQFASGSDDCSIRLWDAATGQPIGKAIPGHSQGVCAIAFSPDGLQIASGSEDHTIRLWDAETGQPIGEPLRGHIGSVLAVAVSPDGLRIASGSVDCMILLWNTKAGQQIGWPLRGHSGSVAAVAFSPDGLQIASGSMDHTIRLWNVATGQPIGEPIQGHSQGVCAIAFSPDGLQIASSSEDETIRLWNVETGQPIGRPLRGHKSSILAIAFSPDGLKIVSGAEDDTIQVWDVETGQLIGEPLLGHQNSICAVKFSPDGSRIASGSMDGTVRIWDAGTGLLLGEPLRGHLAGVSAVAFSPDGLRIASGSQDTTIRLWHADSDQPMRETAITWDVLSDVNEGTPRKEAIQQFPTISIQNLIPGFQNCILLPDGWVQSSGRYLFWVPPDNRYGILSQHIMTIPTWSPLRVTRLDFTHFQCGPFWTNVRNDIKP